MRFFHPTDYMPRVEEIDLATLAQDGVRGIIVDLDNTLVGHRALAPESDVVAWVAAATTHGIGIVMVTNNKTDWARGVAAQLGLPIVANARKPLGRGFRRALRIMRLERDAVVVVGDQLFTDVIGAKLFGLRVILVDPLVRRDPLRVLPLRLLERFLLRDLPRTRRRLDDEAGSRVAEP